ncbi:helix-turn-helix domain-containing protein [Hymenobacter algoricola]|uniref:HTH cro/C1-type domain-containing protein n=1 Tax=Hymenobacter algoricola TaxID=486267 RepID=A0ABP7NMU2_9BACT
MVERIRRILEVRQLSPTQFADAIGIARPIVSHILSGRNKPSLEVVQKVIAAFPDLSLPWLLSGSGGMLASAAPLVAQEPAREPATAAEAVARPRRARAVVEPPAPPVAIPTAAVAREITTQLPLHLVTTPPVSSAATEPVAAPVEAAPPQPQASPPPAMVATPAPPIISAAAAPAPARVAPALASAFLSGSEKAIRRIVIFYHDGTFADYQPEK